MAKKMSIIMTYEHAPLILKEINYVTYDYMDQAIVTSKSAMCSVLNIVEESTELFCFLF